VWDASAGEALNELQDVSSMMERSSRSSCYIREKIIVDSKTGRQKHTGWLLSPAAGEGPLISPGLPWALNGTIVIFHDFLLFHKCVPYHRRLDQVLLAHCSL
jgi:hypothetical protein